MKEITKYWLKYADSDFIASKKLIKESDCENIVLFHCQQAIEKIIKAIYEELDINIPKIHNINRLYELLPENIKIILNLNIEELNILDSIYIESRYPSDIGILPTGFPSKEKTISIFEFTSRMFNNIKMYIEKI